MKKSEIKAIAEEIREISLDIDNPDFADEEGEIYVDVRLQVVDGSWHIHTGDSSYDTDHHGNWGASTISPNLTKEQAMEIAVDLVNQAEDMEAM